jgi:hypothetical protein
VADGGVRDDVSPQFDAAIAVPAGLVHGGKLSRVSGVDRATPGGLDELLLAMRRPVAAGENHKRQITNDKPQITKGDALPLCFLLCPLKFSLADESAPRAPH